jgi:UDP-N-acetylglucosamine 2-epimerase (non-hydrolysing)
LAEAIPTDKVIVTGNTVVDSLKFMLKRVVPSQKIIDLIESTEGLRRILLTTHRRESFGAQMSGNLKVIADFVERRKNVCLFFPVHPNPNVRMVTNEILADKERVFLIDPLNYSDFLALMKSVWLIVSDSGGIQEEAPSLGKPMLVLRENTERPEAIMSGVAKLVGGKPSVLKKMLEENYSIDTWTKSVKEVSNPFGDGRAAKRIVKTIEERFRSASAKASKANRPAV